MSDPYLPDGWTQDKIDERLDWQDRQRREQGSESTPERAVSADGRYVIRRLWTPSRNAYCWHVGERKMSQRMRSAVRNVAVIPDAPGLTAAEVLARWEREMEDLRRCHEYNEKNVMLPDGRHVLGPPVFCTTRKRPREVGGWGE